MSFLETESATFEDLCLRLERDFPGSPAAAFLQRFYEWRRYTATLQREADGMREALAIADGDLDFAPPLTFEFAQSSDETGEYYVSKARFVDAQGHTIMDLRPYSEGWVDTQMHAIAALLNIARRAALNGSPQEQAE